MVLLTDTTRAERRSLRESLTKPPSCTGREGQAKWKGGRAPDARHQDEEKPEKGDNVIQVGGDKPPNGGNSGAQTRRTLSISEKGNKSRDQERRNLRREQNRGYNYIQLNWEGERYYYVGFEIYILFVNCDSKDLFLYLSMYKIFIWPLYVSFSFCNVR